MSLKDPRFVDQEKLDSYAEQAFGSLRKVDPELKKSIELGLTGLKIKLEETDKSRPLNNWEKIDLIVKYLESKGELLQSRPSKRHEKAKWVKETVNAYKIVVPNSPYKEHTSPAFSFWLAPETEEAGILCAVQGASGSDQPALDYSGLSTYSVLQSLVYFTRQQNRAGILNIEIPSDPHPNPNAKVDSEHPPSLLNEYHNVKTFAYEFSKAPIQLLTQWNCRCSELQRVTFLCRVREYGPEAGNGWEKMATFGYAVYVYDE